MCPVHTSWPFTIIFLKTPVLYWTRDEIRDTGWCMAFHKKRDRKNSKVIKIEMDSNKIEVYNFYNTP